MLLPNALHFLRHHVGQILLVHDETEAVGVDGNEQDVPLEWEPKDLAVWVKVGKGQHGRRSDDGNGTEGDEIVGGIRRGYKDEGGVAEAFRKGDGVMLGCDPAGNGQTPRFEEEGVAPLPEKVEDLPPGRLCRRLLVRRATSQHTGSPCTTTRTTNIGGAATSISSARRRPSRHANDGGLRPLLTAGLLRRLPLPLPLPRDWGGAVVARSDPCRSGRKGECRCRSR
mmetsp:Transcript_28248/g.81703  ORF Transcript_28248/g.81703 Transcript_28248/m.81703 type:complete len:226 (+) Transcript_28248:1055-1732(+)